MRIQTQGRSAEERESPCLYRLGCGGGVAAALSQQLQSSWAGGSRGLKKRGKSLKMSIRLYPPFHSCALSLRVRDTHTRCFQLHFSLCGVQLRLFAASESIRCMHSSVYHAEECMQIVQL